MKKRCINLICFAAEKTGVFSAIRHFCAKNKITIINYHDPSPEIFEQHVRYFSRYYTLISIDTAVKAIRENISQLPPFPMVITFDDGHAGNYKLLPIFQKYKIPATIYVTAGLTGTNRHFWWKELREQNLSHAIGSLKKLPSGEFRKRLADLCEYSFEREYPERQALDWHELHELQKAGITIGAHSVNHPLLDQCTPEELEHECTESKRILEDGLQTEIVHFALPNGNHSPQVIAALQKAKFQTNRTILPDWNMQNTSLFQLNDFGISDYAGTFYAAAQAAGGAKWKKH